ncbi:MAG: DUF1376 domain-containing protein [Gallionella sp.]|nr:DUF1376 domain-containing protein [Gallionella sp.]
MAEFPSMPLWTDAYLADTSHLTTIEHGAYLLLLMIAWRTQEKRLPDDDKLLARYAKMTPSQWKRIRPVMSAFFKIENGYWTQGRLIDEANAVKRYRERQSAAGKASALKRNGRHSTTVELGCNRSPTPSPSPSPISNKEEPPITPQHTAMRDWPDIPDWIPVEPWNAFIAMRRRKSGMPTPRAIELLIGKLDRWKATGHDPGAVLDQSTENQWTGIFEIKQDWSGNGKDRRGGSASGDGFIRALDRKLAEHANGSGLGQASGEVGTAGHRLALVDSQGSRTP